MAECIAAVEHRQIDVRAGQLASAAAATSTVAASRWVQGRLSRNKPVWITEQ